MSKKDRFRVRTWPQVSTRIDPDVKAAFDKKIKQTGDDKSEVIRRGIRKYLRDD